MPAAQGELPYPEWSKLVSGLMDDTPLGRVVAVRAERDRKVIAKMTPWQRRVRAEWRSFLAKRTDPETQKQELAALQRSLAAAFGGEATG